MVRVWGWPIQLIMVGEALKHSAWLWVCLQLCSTECRCVGKVRPQPVWLATWTRPRPRHPPEPSSLDARCKGTTTTCPVFLTVVSKPVSVQTMLCRWLHCNHGDRCSYLTFKVGVSGKNYGRDKFWEHDRSLCAICTSCTFVVTANWSCGTLCLLVFSGLRCFSVCSVL